jgi:hypothetical protein
MAVTLRHCSTCGEERPFERLPRPDGHGDLWLEPASVECGMAVLLADLLEPYEPAPVDQTQAVSPRAA